MIFTWYKIFNLVEFMGTGLVSRTLDLELTDIGPVSILITRGELVSILYDGVFLPIDLNQVNPFSMDGYAVYVDGANDVFLGFEVDET